MYTELFQTIFVTEDQVKYTPSYNGGIFYKCWKYIFNVINK